MDAREITIADYVQPAPQPGIAEPEAGQPTKPGRAVVTGASSGIGRDTVIRLVEQGWQVVAVARRADRLAQLVHDTGCQAFAADLTDVTAVEALANYVLTTGGLTAVVNVAGGAFGIEQVADATPANWRKMFELNVMTTLQTTQAFLPYLREHGGDVVVVTSVAGHEAYATGAGYTASKHAESMICQTLRLELVGEPVRIIEVCPGLVQTAEFTFNRNQGDAEGAAALYNKVSMPLAGTDIADVIAWTLSRPQRVNIDRVMVTALEQSTATTLVRLQA